MSAWVDRYPKVVKVEEGDVFVDCVGGVLFIYRCTIIKVESLGCRLKPLKVTQVKLRDTKITCDANAEIMNQVQLYSLLDGN